MKEHKDRFPARLPPDLKRALEVRAKTLGTSMNDLVVLGVRSVVEEGADLTVTTSGVDDAHEDLVVATIEGHIAPAKGIARHYVESQRPHLGALIYNFASLMQPDPKEKAKELVKSAGMVRDRSRPIAIALLRAALEHNPGSDLVKSRLGELLYFEGQYAEAQKLLEGVRHDNNHAKLAYGWSTLELADDDPTEVARARDEIVVALRRWALEPSPPEKRQSWISQVAKLKALGPEFEQAVVELVAYANDNGSWGPIDVSETQPATQATAPDWQAPDTRARIDSSGAAEAPPDAPGSFDPPSSGQGDTE